MMSAEGDESDHSRRVTSSGTSGAAVVLSDHDERLPVPAADPAVMSILLAISLSHMLNDIMQAVIPAIYPIIRDEFSLTFAQVGIIQLTFQLTASILQPMVGLYTDKRPQPFSLAAGMGCTLVGLLLLSSAASYPMILFSVAFVGIGSSIFHPEASRVARMASGGRHGLAQSLFQVGGNVGSAIGPLLAAFIVSSRGQGNVAWFSLFAFAGMFVLTRVGFWYQSHERRPKRSLPVSESKLPDLTVARALTVLGLLMFSKFFYMASMTSYFTFYLIETFGLSVSQSQVFLFVFLAAVASGTLLGGALGDRIGRKAVLWFSILGALPFTLLMPHVGLIWTCLFSVVIGFILSSAFPAIVVYAQELVPGKVGMISGVFFGLAFGLGGIGAAVLGYIADITSIQYVYQLCAYLPMIGLLVIFLPDTRQKSSS